MKTNSKKNRVMGRICLRNRFKTTEDVKVKLFQDNDIIVDELILKPQYLALLPVPAGEYRVKITVGAYNDWKAVPVSLIKFTNIKCKTLDKSFADFGNCKLKALSRDEVALSLRVNLFEVPVNNVSLNVELFKKFNGYRPFLFNKTVDFCEFLRNKKRVGFFDIIFKFLEAYSNINHTCPYNNDIIVDRLILKPQYFVLLPLPEGEYRLKIAVGAYNDWKAIVNVFLQVWE
ncbi:uncharacterized protein LOC105214603 [Zeugodacus cucurbitae]|uniref:uncharacterized protein LOC105214603 n=1 Tax=Zeugodacus cucurbitae TaxID=28588 RepID=UPI0023D8F5AF|nr:uncharacterized protein LOC105214603 [Zeugodacus cucurbitae]